MGFATSVTTCLRKYADFSGRASRSELWWFVLFYVLLLVGAGLIDQAIGLHLPINDNIWVVNGQNVVITDYYTPGWAEAVVTVGLFLPMLAVQVRRLHDRDASGWWWWLNLLNCMCGLGTLILVFAFYVQPGTPGPNKFGAPQGHGAAP